MAGEWPTLSLRDAKVELIDCDHRTPPASLTGYPYVAIPQLRGGRVDLSHVRRIKREHFVEWTKKAKPSADDVILSRRCNPGETAVAPPDLDFALGQNLVLLRSDGSKVYPPFLRWLVRGPEWWGQIAKFLNVGAVFDSLRCADIPNFELRIPPLSEQRAIARIAGMLDDKIELNRRMNETLEATAKEIFRASVADAQNGNADEEFEITMGQSPPGETYNELGTGLPFFQGRADFGFRYPTERVYCIAPTRLASAGDTLVSVRAPVGDINMALVGCAVGRGVAAVRHRSGSRSFTYYAMRGLRREFDVFESEGTVFGSLSKKDFHRLRVPALAPADVARFEDLAGPLDRRIELNERESRTLAALRDALVPKLISGELRIRDTDRAIEQAT